MGVHTSEWVYNEVKMLLGIPVEEPIFILRAQDRSTVDTLNDYLRHNYLRHNEVEGNDPSWLERVRQCRDTFDDWQIKNSNKVKRAD